MTEQIHHDSSPRLHFRHWAVNDRIHTDLTKRLDITCNDTGSTG